MSDRVRLAIALIGTIVLVAPAFDYLTRSDYQADAQRVRVLVQPADTQDAFTRVLEQDGMRCELLGEDGKSIVFCRWTKGLPFWSWLAWFEMFPKGVVTRGEFIDGRKAAEYQVSVQTMGP